MSLTRKLKETANKKPCCSAAFVMYNALQHLKITYTLAEINHERFY